MTCLEDDWVTRGFEGESRSCYQLDLEKLPLSSLQQRRLLRRIAQLVRVQGEKFVLRGVILYASQHRSCRHPRSPMLRLFVSGELLN